MNLPPSWSSMTDHAKACYLANTHQARDYHAARNAIGREKRETRIVATKITVPQYTAQMERRNIF